MADDLALCCGRPLALALGLLATLVSPGSLVVILWGLSGSFSLTPEWDISSSRALDQQGTRANNR